MTANQCPSLAAMLRNGQQVTHRRHQCGWIETPDGRDFQPKASEVQFIKGCRTPFMAKPRGKTRWWARLMGIFA
ncbi:phage filamentation protein Fil family protein [Yersinia massiliensis]|uniref:phage filamentation protein Fil family protein n=1 Tax=Yersinia massiliensis TaxID=419257 RepID=UPI0002DACE44|nr:phage filamentation protein Fil family protein [Yersinia massiliensis]